MIRFWERENVVTINSFKKKIVILPKLLGSGTHQSFHVLVGGPLPTVGVVVNPVLAGLLLPVYVVLMKLGAVGLAFFHLVIV